MSNFRIKRFLLLLLASLFVAIFVVSIYMMSTIK